MSKRNTHIGFFNTLTVVNTSMTAKYNPLTNLNHNAYMQVFHSGVGGGAQDNSATVLLRSVKSKQILVS